MKRIFMSILAVVFPWMVMLINDDPMGALIAMVLQASVVGWIPASMWAWRVVHKPSKVTKSGQKKSRVKS